MKAIYITHSGNDMLVVNAARASFGKFEDLNKPLEEKDINLIQFLARGMKTKDWNSLLEQVVNCSDVQEAERLLKQYKRTPIHWVPFGHPHITLQECMPIFVARQRYKHMVGIVYSEESRRYLDSIPEAYEFDFIRARPDADIKQGSGGRHPDSDELNSVIIEFTENAIALYDHLISQNVAPEQARAILTQNAEITCVVTGSLYAFANSYIQRSDSHAQKEIQYLAEMWDQIISPLYPISWAALTK